MMFAGFVLMRRHPESALSVLFVLAPFVAAAPFVIHRLVIDRTRARAVVLWVRRFHRGKRSTVEQTFLEFVITDWGQLITLSDTVVDEDSASRMMLTWKYCVIVAVFAGIAWLISGLGLNGLIGTLIGFGWVLRRRAKRARVNLASDSLEVGKMVDAIRKRKLPSAGSVVLRCPRDGELWRRVITELSERADAASFQLEIFPRTWIGRFTPS
jgi:hypothetical protein